MARARGDSLTGDLLAWEPPKVAAGFAEGAVRGSRIANQISQVVKLALEGRDRGEVAARMSSELGYAVSRDMLDHYAAEGSEAHKIPLERFIALIEATDCVDALAFVAERVGHVVVPERYAAIVEYHLLEEHEQDVTRRKQAAFAKMKGGAR